MSSSDPVSIKFGWHQKTTRGRVISKEIRFFPDRSGILFNQSFGKTLRGNAFNTFAVRRCSTQILSPVKNFERYLELCHLLHVVLSAGFLFRATKGNSILDKPFIAFFIIGLNFTSKRSALMTGEPHIVFALVVLLRLLSVTWSFQRSYSSACRLV